MTSVLILSHGGLAKELLGAAEMITGGAPPWIRAVSLDWDATFEEARRETAAVIDSMNPHDGLLILTDIYGTTPFNVATSFVDSADVQVLAGVNLPMVLRLCCLGHSEMSAAELVPWLEEKGRRSICHCDGNARRQEVGSLQGDSDRGHE